MKWMPPGGICPLVILKGFAWRVLDAGADLWGREAPFIKLL